MNDPYHVHMDLDVINNDYSSTRNTPSLWGDSADSFCSIVRFNIQTGNTLPVFIPKIETGIDRRRTVYSLTLNLLHYASGHESYSATVSVRYDPEDLTAPLPANPTNGQDVSSTYYYVYTYQHFVKLVNNALRTAWDELKQLWITSGQDSGAFPQRTTYEQWEAAWAEVMGGRRADTQRWAHHGIAPYWFWRQQLYVSTSSTV